MQTLLLALYNLEAGSEAQNPKTQSFRIPNIAQPSIFHDVSISCTLQLNRKYLIIEIEFLDLSISCILINGIGVETTRSN